MDGLPPSEFRVLGEKCSARWTSLGFTSLIIQNLGGIAPKKNSHKFSSWHSLDVRDERNRRMEFSTSSVIILNVICCFFWAFSLLWNIKRTKFSTSSVIMLQNCFLSLFNKKKIENIFSINNSDLVHKYWKISRIFYVAENEKLVFMIVGEHIEQPWEHGLQGGYKWGIRWRSRSLWQVSNSM